MYTHVFIIILSASRYCCFAGYELFQGFYVTDVNDTSRTTRGTFLESLIGQESLTSEVPQLTQENETILMRPQDKNTTTSHAIVNQISSSNQSRENISLVTTSQRPATLRPTKLECPEDERPSNIGPYEIPTQRDMVLFTRSMLLDMFNTYNKDAFYLLKDIREATKATASVAKKCKGSKREYKQCVKRVSRQSQLITKGLVKALENHRQEILNLTTANICNLSDMMKDPIEMLKSLAQQKVSLDFALPGFLRLLSACSLICMKSESTSSAFSNKPMRRLTYQDLIIKQFLTRKNYLDLIMDSRHNTIANSN